ncbi:hypothetical protein ANCCAN_11215 [Ancylostoma caninum]|uniref:Uncharacterized protein n=1 Tax=Ancylostoma caninum TaxID=29170 RepID=A0A368GJ02_ANCCA|nr:hypothetical protein ANCCAN_11215 [Ancylostoma caninum]
MTSLQKQLNEEARKRIRVYASKFGSMKFPAPPGDWFIHASMYGPGDELPHAFIFRIYYWDSYRSNCSSCNLVTIYNHLRTNPPFSRMGLKFDSKKFLQNFITDIVNTAYDEENRHFVTARVRDQQNILIRLDHHIIIKTLCEPVRRAGDGAPSWPMTVPKDNRGELLKALRTTIWSGTARAFPRTPNDIKRTTGSQLMELFEFVVPLLLFENLSSSRKDVAVVMAFLFVLKTETAEELKQLLFWEKVRAEVLQLCGNVSLECSLTDRVDVNRSLNGVSYKISDVLRQISFFNGVLGRAVRALKNTGCTAFLSAISLAGFRYGTVYGQRGTTTQNYVISLFHQGRIAVGEVMVFGITDAGVLMAVHKLDAVSPFHEMIKWLRSNDKSGLLNTYRYIESKKRFWFTVKHLSEVIVTSANNIRGPGFNVQSPASANTYFFCKKQFPA